MEHWGNCKLRRATNSILIKIALWYIKFFAFESRGKYSCILGDQRLRENFRNHGLMRENFPLSPTLSFFYVHFKRLCTLMREDFWDMLRENLEMMQEYLPLFERRIRRKDNYSNQEPWWWYRALRKFVSSKEHISVPCKAMTFSAYHWNRVKDFRRVKKLESQ